MFVKNQIMDISILIVVIILGFIGGRILFLIYNQNRIEKLFHQKAQEFGMVPNIKDFTPALLLGLDLKLKKLIIIKRINRKSHLISLSEIAKCELITEDRKCLPGKKNRISLVLSYKKSEKPPIEINFYNLDDDPDREVEMQFQLSKKWQELITKPLVP